MIFGFFKQKPLVLTVKKKTRKKTTKSHPKKTRTKAKKPTSLKKIKTRTVQKGLTREKKQPTTKKFQPKEIGRITHYFPHVKAAVILITTGNIIPGDTLQIKGPTTNFKQKVKSMQIDNVPIQQAKKGQEIGLLVKARVRRSDLVYKFIN